MTGELSPSNPLLTTEEAAKYLCQRESALVYWRRYEPKYGPPWVKVGRRVFYRVSDLDDWIDQMQIPIDCWRAYEEHQ